MKILFVFLFLILQSLANGQSISLQMGRSLGVGNMVGLRYEHSSNSRLHLCLGGYMEHSQRNGLNYSAYGANLLLNGYATHSSYDEGRFGLKTGVGLLWQIENEPWLYRDWTVKQRSSFGLTGELSGCWFMTEAFTLNSFLQQKILFNPLLGRSRFVIGLELAYRMGL